MSANERTERNNMVKSLETGVERGVEKGFKKYFRASDAAKGHIEKTKEEPKKITGKKTKEDPKKPGIFQTVGGMAKRQWEKEKEAVKKYWESDAVVAIRGFFSNAYNSIKGHIDEVLGPLKEFFDLAVESIKKIGNFFKSIFMSVFGKIFGIGGKKDPQKEQVSWLKKLYKFMVGDAARRRKEAARGKGKKDDGFGFFEYGLIGAAILGLVALIGGFARSLILPFELIIKGIKQFKIVGIMMSNIAVFLKKIPILGKFIPIVSKFFGTIQKLFKGIGSILGKFGKLLTKIPMLGGFLKSVSGALKLGFRALGWPIAIIFGLIDFIRGFVKTQGSLVDKIKAGLQLAVMNFLELPVKLIGWMADKVLGWFGVKVEGGTASKMMEGLKWAVGFAVDMVVMWINTWKLIFEGIISFFKKEDSEGTSRFEKVMGFFKQVIESLKWAFWNLSPIGWIIRAVNWFADFLSKKDEDSESRFEKIVSKILNIREMFTNFIDNMVQTALKKLERIPGFKTISKGVKGIKGWFSKDKDVIDPMKTTGVDEIDSARRKEIENQRRKEELERKQREKQIEATENLAKQTDASLKASKEALVIASNSISNNQKTDRGTDMEKDDDLMLAAFAGGFAQ